MRRPTGSPIITSTTWDDSGYDCDHCGGRILKRTDRETGLRDRVCYQCEACSCQWTLEHRPLRVGTTPACRAAQRERAGAAEATGGPTWLWPAVVLGALVLFLLLRFGGAALLRVGLPLLALGLLVFIALRYARLRGWW